MRHGGEIHDDDTSRSAGVRLDQWLWAARFFRTRSLAAAAVDGGKVHLNGARVRRAHPVAVGDLVRVKQGPWVHEVVVRAVSARRGAPTAAADLYQETAASREARERLRWQLRQAGATLDDPAGRPTKRDRRALDRLRGRD